MVMVKGLVEPLQGEETVCIEQVVLKNGRHAEAHCGRRYDRARGR